MESFNITTSANEDLRRLAGLLASPENIKFTYSSETLNLNLDFIDVTINIRKDFINEIDEVKLRLPDPPETLASRLNLSGPPKILLENRKLQSPVKLTTIQHVNQIEAIKTAELIKENGALYFESSSDNDDNNDHDNDNDDNVHHSLDFKEPSPDLPVVSMSKHRGRGNIRGAVGRAPRKNQIIPRSATSFNCAECNITYKTKGSLYRHFRQIHVKGKQIACIFPGCNKKFYNTSAMRYHQITHNEEKKFPCAFCQYRAKRRFDTLKHMKTCKERQRLGMKSSERVKLEQL